MEPSNRAAAEAAEALQLIQLERQQVAERWISIWWWYPLLGLMSFVLIASIETGNRAVILPALIVWIGGQGAMIGWYGRLTGLSISAHRLREQVVALILLILAVGAVVGLAALIENYFQVHGAYVGAAVVVAVLLTAIGPRIEALAREEIRHGR